MSQHPLQINNLLPLQAQALSTLEFLLHSPSPIFSIFTIEQCHHLCGGIFHVSHFCQGEALSLCYTPETFYITLLITCHNMLSKEPPLLNKQGSFSVIFGFPAPSTMPGIEQGSLC